MDKHVAAKIAQDAGLVVFDPDDGTLTDGKWHGCPLVNMLCPDDLCTLPIGHDREMAGWHQLESWVQPLEVNPEALWMAPYGSGKEDLIAWGWESQREWLEEIGKWEAGALL
jgi:hypothetical protein